MVVISSPTTRSSSRKRGLSLPPLIPSGIDDLASNQLEAISTSGSDQMEVVQEQEQEDNSDPEIDDETWHILDHHFGEGSDEKEESVHRKRKVSTNSRTLEQDKNEYVEAKKRSLLKYLRGIVHTWENGVDARGPWKDLKLVGWFFESQKIENMKLFIDFKTSSALSLEEMVSLPALDKCLHSNICSLSNIVQLLNGQEPKEGILSEHQYGLTNIRFQEAITSTITHFSFHYLLQNLQPAFGTVEELMESPGIIHCCQIQNRTARTQCITPVLQKLWDSFQKLDHIGYQERVNLAKVASTF